MQNIVLKINSILTFLYCHFFDTFNAINSWYGLWNRTIQYFYVFQTALSLVVRCKATFPEPGGGRGDRKAQMV